MSKPIIDKMVDRFLGWKLPNDFVPDCYISFDRDTAEKNGWPVGTNLLTAVQAREMFEHALGEDVARIVEENNNLRSHRNELMEQLGAANAKVTGRPPAEGGECDELGEHDGR